MLSPIHRLRRSVDFAGTVRAGTRSGQPTVVVHFRCVGAGPAEPRVGFVVGKAVGPAVVRNRVRRRLRHLVRDRLDQLPARSQLVVRALPGAATADFPTLGRHLERALGAVLPDKAVRPDAPTGANRP